MRWGEGEDTDDAVVSADGWAKRGKDSVYPQTCITDAHAALCVQSVMEDTSGEGKEQRQSLAMFVWQKGVCTKREERQERKKGYIILNMTLAVISLDFVEFSIGF